MHSLVRTKAVTPNVFNDWNLTEFLSMRSKRVLSMTRAHACWPTLCIFTSVILNLRKTELLN